MIWVSVMLFAGSAATRLASRRMLPDIRRVLTAVSVALFGAAVVLLVLSVFTIVPAGHVGVPVVFGSVQFRSVPEGLHVVNPFADVVKLSVRTETYTMVATVDEGQVRGDDSIYALSADQVQMALDVTVAYKLVDRDAPWVYRNLSRQYVESIVRPAARTAVPEATAGFIFQEATSSRREELAERMRERLTQRIRALLSQYGDFKGTGVLIQQVFLRKIELPVDLKRAIEDKMRAEQEALRMRFVLDRERQEAERKRIEARGIADFQAIVTNGISDKLLSWKGIEATELLAKSPNAKVVIVGAGKGGLPVILNTQ